jgi:hypothetical protein
MLAEFLYVGLGVCRFVGVVVGGCLAHVWGFL